MIEIIYLNDANQETVLTYPDYDSYQKSQMGCQLPAAEHHRVKRLTYKGKVIAYEGSLGGVFYFLMKQDLNDLN